MDNSKDKTPRASGQTSLDKETTYTIKGNVFIAQPIFKEDSKNKVGTILMRLMQSDSEKS